MSRSKYQRERERLSRELEEKLQRKISGIQARVYRKVLQGFTSLTNDQSGNLLFNIRNIQNANRIALMVETEMQKEGRTLLKWVVRNLLKLFRLNTRYFASLDPKSEQREQQLLFRVMLRYGYNTKTKQVTSSGVLSALSQSQAISSRVSESINQGLAAKMTMSTFKNNFRQAFVNPQGLGMVQSQFNRFAQDLFQDFDRETQKQYADDLKLNFAIYSGTEIKTTRDFCEKRVNNIYTRDEINSWNNQNWAGKRQNVPVEVQCGGYNCRHHLSYISDELAQRLASRRGGINNYN